MLWETGKQIVQYEMWDGQIGTARPVTVVQDSPEWIVLYTHPGAPFVTRGIENRQAMDLSERIDLYMRPLDPGDGDFRRVISADRQVLAFHDKRSWNSVLLFWSIDWQFKFWYVNLQTPIERFKRGVAFQDYALDIVVHPDMTWDWKDVDEFEELVVRGFFSREEISNVRAEADRMVAVIESGGAPFCDGWENWRPVEDWPIPCLPDDWNAIE